MSKSGENLRDVIKTSKCPDQGRLLKKKSAKESSPSQAKGENLTAHARKQCDCSFWVKRYQKLK